MSKWIWENWTLLTCCMLGNFPCLSWGSYSIFPSRTKTFSIHGPSRGICVTLATVSHWCIFSCNVCWLFSKLTFSRIFVRNTFRLSDSLDPDQDRHSVSPMVKVQTVCKDYQQLARVKIVLKKVCCSVYLKLMPMAFSIVFPSCPTKGCDCLIEPLASQLWFSPIEYVMFTENSNNEYDQSQSGAKNR